eukprot:CAMPEP_0197324756 /NCGR_PEP_ID=MMETSP0891-20130614/71283_1 /TAXON_ID=44058 ORGANISM="Aureoumbra lagunensis, Strain CCMP1510" /NCGR_SAMPLE_ID=MMETSP0891 /ASSEMBLY_ACC=CAM_ASM_000534 /LENGTH=480 /DNA_ID=CAMNT_0042817611 /DNA_START=499 /DNA_END=1941 /DNA_ORIENTATION=-
MVEVDAQVLCVLGHSLSRDPRYSHVEESNQITETQGILEKPLVNKIEPLALWLEAARRISVDAVNPLENLIKQSAPSLAHCLDDSRSLAEARIKETQNAPLAILCCELPSFDSTLRLVAHILGPPIDSSSNQIHITPTSVGVALIVFEWGDRIQEEINSQESISVTYLRSPRPALRRFSLALFVVKPGEPIRQSNKIDSIFGENVQDQDDDSHQQREQSIYLDDFRSRADVIFQVTLLGTEPSIDFGLRFFPHHQTNHVLIAGDLARSGLGPTLKAMGAILFSLAQSRKVVPPPDFFVLGPLDTSLQQSTPKVPLTFARNVLAYDERRLLRIFAALPRARALQAVDALLARARVIRIIVLSLEAIVQQQSKWWWHRPWYFFSLSFDDDDPLETRAKKMLHSLDAAEIRALSSDHQLPLQACRAALLDLDRRKWDRLFSKNMANSLTDVVNTQLPRLLESATALSRDADRAARRSVSWKEI